MEVAAHQEDVVVKLNNYWLDKKTEKSFSPCLTSEEMIATLEELVRYKNTQITQLVATIESLVAQVVALKKGE